MVGRRVGLTYWLVAVVLFASTAATAQDVYGSYGVYDPPALSLPRAPRGYKPFYISHLGRHGARFALTHYDVVMAGLDTARALGLLTEAGERFHSDYTAFYEDTRYRQGDLTAKGAAQHRGIALRMYKRFPAVFRGPTEVLAVSTTVPRVIRSMDVFLAALERCDRSLTVTADASLFHQRYIDPVERKNPGAFPRKDIGAAVKSANAYFLSRMDWEGFAGRLFTDPKAFSERVDKLSFELCLYRVVQSLVCLDRTYPGFEDLFTPDQMQALAVADSYRSYVTDGLSPLNNRLRADICYVLLEEMIAHADADMARGTPALRLRFSHDSALMPLLSLMDVNGMGVVTEDPEEAYRYWKLSSIPMAASLQWIFYENGKGGLLVQVLLNEVPAVLPIREMAPGGYYDWNQFKAFYEKVMDAARTRLDGWSVPGATR